MHINLTFSNLSVFPYYIFTKNEVKNFPFQIMVGGGGCKKVFLFSSTFLSFIFEILTNTSVFRLTSVYHGIYLSEWVNIDERRSGWDRSININPPSDNTSGISIPHITPASSSASYAIGKIEKSPETPSIKYFY